MKKTLGSLLILLTCICAFAKEALAPQPPVAKKVPKELTIHGDTRIDNYYWMKERNNPEVKAYLEAENKYADSIMLPTVAFQEKLYKEMISHLKETDESAPVRDGNYYYYNRTEQGKQYSIYCRKKGTLTAPEEVILDVNEVAKNEPFAGLGAFKVSPDGNLLTYSVDPNGYREYILRIKDLRTGKMLPDKVEKVSYSVVWANDNKTIFYSTIDAAKRPYRINRHVLGTKEDSMAYEDKDETYYVSASATRDRKYIFLVSSATNITEYSYIAADHPEQKPTVIIPRQSDHEYSVDHRNGLFYILTNLNAKNFRLVQAPVESPLQDHWKELVPYRKEVMLEEIDLFENHCILSEREGGLEQLDVLDLRTNKSHRIETPDPVYSISVASNPEFKTKILRFNYESMVLPWSDYDYDMDTRKRTLVKQWEVPNYNPVEYTSERFFVTASDGAKVPVSMVYKKGVEKNGSAPLLLEGYGAYGAPYSVNFSSSRLVLLNRGMIYALAHIRGGGDLGREWYEQGRMLHKKNTFTDFIAVAQYLVDQKYTSKDRLVATGGSAGGLLMGAITNMRPDLFEAIVNYVPFVDAVTTMLDPTIPLTVPEFTEWGDPKIKEQYDYIKSYSPYDNIAAKDYPAILVRTSFWDSQVQYWEPAKYVAKLRATKTDKNVLLLKTQMTAAGHGGRAGRYNSLRDEAFDDAFILTQVGITN
jgi:oligopeptidase B